MSEEERPFKTFYKNVFVFSSLSNHGIPLALQKISISACRIRNIRGLNIELRQHLKINPMQSQFTNAGK